MNKSGACGAGLLAVAVAGIIGGYNGGHLNFWCALPFFLLVMPIKPGGSKAMGMLAYIIAAVVCMQLFKK